MQKTIRLDDEQAVWLERKAKERNKLGSGLKWTASSILRDLIEKERHREREEQGREGEGRQSA